MATVKDMSFEIDDFSQNKILEGVVALAQQLYILLNMRPGDAPDDPEKGINFLQYRVGFAEENGSFLKASIEKQVEEYCEFNISEIEILLRNGELILGITSPSFNEIIVFKTDNENILTSIINS